MSIEGNAAIKDQDLRLISGSSAGGINQCFVQSQKGRGSGDLGAFLAVKKMLV